MIRGRIFLYPLSVIYGSITGIRNFLYNTGFLPSVEFRFPVICVGNITVGGTGKTPHTEYIAALLRKSFKVAVLSRGYKRKTGGFLIVEPGLSAESTGDEPMQMALKFPDIVVAVDRNRVKGVRKIMNRYPDTEVIILDDGFQHRRITPGFSILLSDFERLIIRDHMLPYGNLRENIRNMRRADIILVTKSPEDISPIQRRLIVKEIDKAPYQNLYFTTVKYEPVKPVFNDGVAPAVVPSIDRLNGAGVLLVTGIANPLPLKNIILKTAGELSHLRYPDHHAFWTKDIMSITKAFEEITSPVKYILTTEKDAVRLKEFTNIAEHIKKAMYYVPVGIDFLNDDKDEFDNLIIEYVRKNKRNNRISEI